MQILKQVPQCIALGFLPRAASFVQFRSAHINLSLHNPQTTQWQSQCRTSSRLWLRSSSRRWESSL